jgi:hypothetical protein
MFDPAAVSMSSLRGWLEDRVGPLAELVIEEEPLPAPQPFTPERDGLSAPAAHDSRSQHRSDDPVLDVVT